MRGRGARTALRKTCDTHASGDVRSEVERSAARDRDTAHEERSSDHARGGEVFGAIR